MSSLLIGLGNADRGDDGLGAAVVRRVVDLAPSRVEAVIVDDPTTLLDTWAGADRVVVVDAMTSGRPPGTVLTMDVTDEPLPGLGWGSGGTHALGLAAATELSRALGRLPQRLLVVAVEAGTAAPGEGLSEPVTAAIGPAADAVLAALDGGDR